MKVSYEWLKTLVNLDGIPFKQLVDDLSLYSIEVESTRPITNATKVVIGYVKTKEKHPHADKLSYCTVNIGDEILPIVCGAPNVEAGQKVIVALPGGRVGNLDIKETSIRGVTSRGMICSFQEIGLETKFIPEEFLEGIVVLDDDAPIGINALTYLGLDDYQIELGLTPNRMDLLSMRGVARDVNAIYGQGLFEEEMVSLDEIDSLTSDKISLKVDTPACYSYYARVIKEVVIKESPNYIKARLIASGIRPINNVVDITNYCLMLFGQPLHAFDGDKLGRNILVRKANQDEKTITLDNQERTLTKDDIVITDGTNVVAIGGVMGCANTEVTEKTRSIVLEAAVFRPLSVRQTSSRLGLRSESSMRFERGVDLNSTLDALNYATFLLEKYANGKVLKGFVHEGTTHIEDRKISVSSKDVHKLLGISLDNKSLINIFEQLGFKTLINNDYLIVSVPNRRLDINIKEDLIEEVVRIYGYDKLPETLPLMDLSGEKTISQKRRSTIMQTLTTLGLKETITYSLTSVQNNQEFNCLLPQTIGMIKLLHPMTEERVVMRTGIVRSLIDVIKYNHARKQDNVAIFEFGKRYYLYDNQQDDIVEDWVLSGALTGNIGGTLWQGKNEKIDFFTVKGILDILFKRLGVNVQYQTMAKNVNELHPEQSSYILFDGKPIGYLGAVHPQYAKVHDLDNTYVFEIALNEILNLVHEVKLFKSISKVPHVERDLALVMDQKQPVGEVLEAIIKTDEKMIRNVDVFDEYLGDKISAGKKSIAIRITLESDETLTEEVIQTKMKKIIKMLAYRFNIILRS